MADILGAKLVLDSSQWVRSAQSASSATNAIVANAQRAGVRMDAGIRKLHKSMEGKTASQRRAIRAEIAQRQSLVQSKYESIGILAGGAMIAGFASSGMASHIFNEGFKPLIDAAAEFDFEFRKMLYLSGLEAGDSIALGLKQTIRSTALQSTLSEADLTKALNNLIKSGVSSADAREMAGPLSKIIEASFGSIDPAQLTRLLGIGLQKFTIDAENAEAKMAKLGDIFLKMENTSPFDLKGIESFMQSLGSAPQLMKNSSMEELLTFATVMRKTGALPRRAGQQLLSFANALQKVQTKLVKGGSAKKGILAGAKALGVSLEDITQLNVSTGQREMKGAMDIFKVLLSRRKAFEGMGTEGQLNFKAALDDLFTRDGATNLLALVDGFKFLDKGTGKTLVGMEAFDSVMTSLSDSTGMADKGAQAFRETWKGSVAIMESAFATIKSILGEVLINNLLPVLKDVNEQVKSFAKLLEKNPGLQKFIVGVLALSGALAVLGGVVFSIVAAVATFHFVLAAVGGLVGGFVVVSFAVVWLGAALIALGGIAYGVFRAIKTNAFGLGDALRKKFDQVVVFFKGLFELFKTGTISKDKHALAKKLGVWQFMKSIFMLWHRVKRFFSTMMQTIDGSGLKKKIGELVAVFGRLFRAIAGGSDTFARDSSAKFATAGANIGMILNIIVWGLEVFVSAMIIAVNIVAGAVETFDEIVTVMNKYGTITSIVTTILGVFAIVVTFAVAIVTTFLLILASVLVVMGAIAIVSVVLTSILIGLLLVFALIGAPIIGLVVVVIALYVWWEDLGNLLIDTVLPALRQVASVAQSAFSSIPDAIRAKFGIGVEPGGNGEIPVDPRQRIPGRPGSNGAQINKPITIGQLNIQAPDGSSPEDLANLTADKIRQIRSDDAAFSFNSAGGLG